MRTTWTTALVILALVISQHNAQASLVIAGSLQTEQGDAADWSPSGSSLTMTDAGGGLFTYTANNLDDGVFYEFKVLDDQGTPPADWGDPEVVNANTMAYGDADGSVEIVVDTTQVNGNGGSVVWVNSDNIPLQVVGNFMMQAGGAGDWNPSDPTFAMTSMGNGYYTIDLVIGTPGSYEMKATDGTGWNYQVGASGFGSNEGTIPFSTTTANEAVTMYVDLAGRSIGVVSVPEPSTALLCLAGLAVVGTWARKR